LLKVERVVVNALAEGAALPPDFFDAMGQGPDYCAFGE